MFGDPLMDATLFWSNTTAATIQRDKRCNTIRQRKHSQDNVFLENLDIKKKKYNYVKLTDVLTSCIIFKGGEVVQWVY